MYEQINDRKWMKEGNGRSQEEKGKDNKQPPLLTVLSRFVSFPPMPIHKRGDIDATFSFKQSWNLTANRVTVSFLRMVRGVGGWGSGVLGEYRRKASDEKRGL